MNSSFHPILVFQLLSALLGVWLAWQAFRHRSEKGALPFALVMAAAAWWAATSVFELTSVTLAAKIFWLQMEYLGILFLPAAWLVFALEYTGRIVPRRFLWLLVAEPAIILILLLTNPYHHLFTQQFGLRAIGKLFVWQNVAGPAYWFNVAYSYALILTGVFLILSHLVRLPRPHTRREMVIVLGVLLPWLGNLVYVFYDWPFPGIDPTPFFLVVSGLVFSWGRISLRFLERQPSLQLSLEEIAAWRSHVLDFILRGIFLLWLLALPAGLYNVWETYQRERLAASHAEQIALGVVAVYVSVTVLVGLLTFRRGIPYTLRAGLFLSILYLLGVLGLALAALSGDGRVFLFAFVVLAAVFFSLPVGWVAMAISVVTLVLMARLQVEGILFVPPERQINSTDVSAWVTSTLVFSVLCVAVLISVSYLLRVWENSLNHLQNTLQRERHLSQILRLREAITRLIVREQDGERLLQQACEQLVAGGGYRLVWAGIVQPDGAILQPVAHAIDSLGGQTKLQSFAVQAFPITQAPCILEALRSQKPLRFSSGQYCQECPIHAGHGPLVHSLVLPLVHQGLVIGVLVIERDTAFDLSEAADLDLLQEMADDLAHALATLRAAQQQKILAEIANSLLFARDADLFWTEVIAAVRRVLHAERVAIYSYNRLTDTLSCERWHGLSSEYVQEINRRFREAPGSQVLQTECPIIVEDIETHPATAPLRDVMRREGFRSYAVFPFYTSRGLQGAFVAYRNFASVFTASDIAAGETLVRMIGLALENMNLYAEARRKAAELSSLYAAAQDMASSLLDSQALLQTLARHVTEALQATSAYISTVDFHNRTICVAAEYWSEHAIPSERKSDLGRCYAFQDYPSFARVLITGEPMVLHRDCVECSLAEREEFAEYGIQSILFLPVLAHGKVVGGIEIRESRRRREFTQAEIFLVQSMAAHAGSVLENAALYEQTRRQAEELAKAYDSTLAGWARALELRDEQTQDHTRRVTELAVALARALGLSEEEIVHIRRGAILHDIGKMAIPDSILLKAGPLTPEEEALMRQHPQFAYDMLSPIEFLRPALDIPYCHHEQWDGQGYPRGLKGEEIPLAARLFAVVDNWDALTSDRPYRPAWSKEQARQYLREQAGKKFDPRIVEVFLRLEMSSADAQTTETGAIASEAQTTALQGD